MKTDHISKIFTPEKKELWRKKNWKWREILTIRFPRTLQIRRVISRIRMHSIIEESSQLTHKLGLFTLVLTRTITWSSIKTNWSSFKEKSNRSGTLGGRTITITMYQGTILKTISHRGEPIRSSRSLRTRSRWMMKITRVLTLATTKWKREQSHTTSKESLSTSWIS